MPGSTQAIGMACVSVGMAVGRGHAARILRAFSTLRYARGDLRADRSADMSERDSDFRIKPGRIRSTRAPRTKSFVNQVLAAAQRAGHTSGGAPAGKAGRRLGHSTFGRGRNVFGRSRIFCASAPRRRQGAHRPPSGQGVSLGAADQPCRLPQARGREPRRR